MIAKKERIALEDITDADHRLERRYKSKLCVNQDLDRTLVSFQANKRKNGYRWCKYKEGFSAELMRYVYAKTGLKSGRVLDPFAGSGTALFSASEIGLDSVGIELLPCSAEIIEVKKIVEDSDKKSLARAVRRFRNKKVWEENGKTVEFLHLRITQGAFPKDTERHIGRYLYEAKRVRDGQLRQLLRFAAMCVLESISFTRKDGQYLRWDSRSGRRAGGKDFNKGPILTFSSAIVTKLDEIADDMEGKQELLFDNIKSVRERGTVDLLMGSCLDILPTMKASSFDGIVTSPPYCNRYDYTRTYALELAMMGIGEEGLKKLRQTMLSCTVENREKKGLESHFQRATFEKARNSFEGQEVLRLVLSHLEQCREDGLLNNNGIPRMVRNYFGEMALVISECRRVLKAGAPFVMVNDNVRYQGAHLPVDLILADFATKAGFDVDTIWVLPRGKGNSSQQMGRHGREEIRKCVYVWRRAKGK